MPEIASKPVRFEDRVAWFQEARFGLFMHWGLYAMPARHEWVMSSERIAPETYRRYFERFDPDLFAPREWAIERSSRSKAYVFTSILASAGPRTSLLKSFMPVCVSVTGRPTTRRTRPK